jgi:hypothetical protein
MLRIAVLFCFFSAIAAQCTCTAGMPPTNAPFSAIAGDAGCAVNFVEFFDVSGATVYSSGNASSRVGPFEITCPGSLITSFVRSARRKCKPPTAHATHR